MDPIKKVKMKNKTFWLLLINSIFIQVLVFSYFFNEEKIVKKIEINKIDPPKQIDPPKTKPISNDIQNHRPDYLNYDGIINQIKEWENEAPELVEVKTYGESSKGKDLYYIRIKNERISGNNPKVLITACIHGNEPLSTSVIMWYIGDLLKSYHSNDEVKEILDSRELYFIPVVSPDSYPRSRFVDGVDPNRNFPGVANPNLESVKPVAALRTFFLKIKPDAVMSGHTYGRVYLFPPGDLFKNCPDHEQYVQILKDMSDLSGYRYIRACDLYMNNGSTSHVPTRTYGIPVKGRNYMVPIYGTETDWYYRNGAFAIVVEFGNHQKIPKYNETQTEFDKTYNSMLYFVKEAPLIKVNPNNIGSKSVEIRYDYDYRDE
jgi:hypothetical protein